jgi:hypothetical protein
MLTHDQAVQMSVSLEKVMRGLDEQIDFALHVLRIHEILGMTAYEWLDSIGAVGGELELARVLYS